ncbi:MAG TPA: hypothetical protein PKX48_15705 [Planctomycetota bacterium]|jgi:hypothetical protein|nr:hypothetical protein [Planctomycetota bacterium]OQC18950.1 MAG: hypothetical protein BWX69_03120 [Planctomycetes bacterium ADurb.Bin069]HNS00710.1 hypothetical protein [Planctomycetota bacterium]HNU27498.1 hypothetical protein [Planctomycetota bacterium]HOE31514.1 hypothetical protein [Planctomycetota bacterium]
MRLAGKGLELFVFGSATVFLGLVIVAAMIGRQGGEAGREERVASAAEVCALAENLAGRADALAAEAGGGAAPDGRIRALLDASMALGRGITGWRNADTGESSKAERFSDAVGRLAAALAAMQSDLPEIERSTRAIDRARDLANDMIRLLLYDLAVEAAPRGARADIIPARDEEPRLLLYAPVLSEIMAGLAERPARPLAAPPFLAAAAEGRELAKALSAVNTAVADHAAVAAAWSIKRRGLERACEELRAASAAFARAAIAVRPPDNREQLWFIVAAAAVVWLAVGLVLLLVVFKDGEAPRRRRNVAAGTRRRATERTR